MVRPFRWDSARRVLCVLDQRRLPDEAAWIECRDPGEVAAAIRDMAIRGAPAIGIAAAYAVVLGFARPPDAEDAAEGTAERFERLAVQLRDTRPTAVNLAGALERMRVRLRSLAAGEVGAGIAAALEEEANRIAAEDLEANRRLGALGASLLPGRGAARVLTHCNAGALATSGYGTALGIVRAAVAAGRPVEVFAPETRPYLQGARLTAWELQAEKIPVTLITDGMVGSLLAAGGVDAVVVGADRIAANGDTANKIGTYQAAVLAREHGVPFLVAAPYSSVDPETPTGADIPIEERSPAEVLEFRGNRVAPAGVPAWNPAFDVTPHRYLTAIVTERGIARPPFTTSLAHLAESPRSRMVRLRERTDALSRLTAGIPQTDSAILLREDRDR